MGSVVNDTYLLCSYFCIAYMGMNKTVVRTQHLSENIAAHRSEVQEPSNVHLVIVGLRSTYRHWL